MTVISDNGVSKVWREGSWAYKQQPVFLTVNELWCLQRLVRSGYVPYAERVEPEIIRLHWVEKQPVTNIERFMGHLPKVLEALTEAGIRHGDLTEYAVIPADNKPILVDFAESRLTCDPRPDKRPEGDRYWLKRTMEKICNDLA